MLVQHAHSTEQGDCQVFIKQHTAFCCFLLCLWMRQRRRVTVFPQLRALGGTGQGQDLPSARTPCGRGLPAHIPHRKRGPREHSHIQQSNQEPVVSATWSPSRGHAAPHVVGGRADPSELQGPASPGVRPPQLTPPGPHSQPSCGPGCTSPCPFCLEGKSVSVFGGKSGGHSPAALGTDRAPGPVPGAPRPSRGGARGLPPGPAGGSRSTRAPAARGQAGSAPQGSLCGQT